MKRINISILTKGFWSQAHESDPLRIWTHLRLPKPHEMPSNRWSSTSPQLKLVSSPQYNNQLDLSTNHKPYLLDVIGLSTINHSYWIVIGVQSQLSHHLGAPPCTLIKKCGHEACEGVCPTVGDDARTTDHGVQRFIISKTAVVKRTSGPQVFFHVFPSPSRRFSEGWGRAVTFRSG